MIDMFDIISPYNRIHAVGGKYVQRLKMAVGKVHPFFRVDVRGDHPVLAEDRCQGTAKFLAQLPSGPDDQYAVVFHYDIPLKKPAQSLTDGQAVST